jgi:hypothetical protein
VLVCTECNNPQGCTAQEQETKAAFCRTHDDKLTIRAVWREHIPWDQLYQDPQGEPYKGLTAFIQTPLLTQVRPVVEDGINKYKLRTEK